MREQQPQPERTKNPEPEKERSMEKVDRPERLAHLREDIKPIYACIGTYSDFADEISQEVHDFDIENIDEDEVDVVDWFADTASLEKKKMKHAGSNTYVISSINRKDKLSEGLYPCSSIIVAGVDAKTGQEISFMTHQTPYRASTKDFMGDLSVQLKDLKDRCKPGTVDVVVAGGSAEDDYDIEEYTQAIDAISKTVNKVVGFAPHIVAGPKTKDDPFSGDAVFYDTKNRRLYLIRPNTTRGEGANAGFHPRDIEKEQKKWES